MYTLGRFEMVRNAAVLWNRYRHPAIRENEHESRNLLPVRIDEAAAVIHKDGFIDGLRLNDETLAQLLGYCRDNPCYAEGERNLPFQAESRIAAERQYGRRILLGRYLDCRSDCAAVRRLETDPTLRGIARQYFTSEPVLIGARMWWSFASDSSRHEQSKSGQTFHYDIDGYRSLAFFFYLTNVDEEAGPHVCVPGSHRKKQLLDLLSLRKSRTDAHIEDVYGRGAIKAVQGKAGEGFAEDIFCFHKGLSPRGRDRLIFQVRFGLRDYGTSAHG